MDLLVGGLLAPMDAMEMNGHDGKQKDKKGISQQPVLQYTEAL